MDSGAALGIHAATSAAMLVQRAFKWAIRISINGEISSKKLWGLCRGRRSSVKNASSNLCCHACRKQGLAMEQVAFEMGAISSLCFCTGWWLNHRLWAMVWLRSSRWLTATLLGRHKLRLPVAGPEQRLAREQSKYETGRCLEKDAGLIKEIWRVVWVSRWSNYHKTGSGEQYIQGGSPTGSVLYSHPDSRAGYSGVMAGKLRAVLATFSWMTRSGVMRWRTSTNSFSPRPAREEERAGLSKVFFTLMKIWTIKIIVWTLNKPSL